MLSNVPEDWIRQPLSYPEYRKHVSTLLAEGKTTGNQQTEALVAYTRLNETRMNRLDRQIQLHPELQDWVCSISAPQRWMVLAEAWCGDCAQNLPVLAKAAAASDYRITLEILDRDECPELMDAFLTRGARSIPKLIVTERDSLKVLGTWGPRPQPVQRFMDAWKLNAEGQSFEDLEQRMHLWYAKDLGHTMQRELLETLKQAAVPIMN